MAMSKCIYPFPTLIIRDVVETGRPADANPWEYEWHHIVTTTREVRLSFYQPEGKAWDWARAERLASQCYPQHGAIEIEHMGEFYSPADAPVVKMRAPAAKVLQQAIRGYLSGTITREALELLAA